MDVIIVPCTQEKIWDMRPDAGSVAAKDAYTKPAFRVWRDYAQRSGCPWFILSTKYGRIAPDHIIERYNVPVSAALKNNALLQLLKQQGADLGLGRLDRIVLLDWERFEPLVRVAAPSPDVKCVLRRLQY